jgi:hypothetical protein
LILDVNELIDPEALPNLPTTMERMAWLLGRLTDQIPAVARPLVRSMLLPALERQDSASLTEILVTIQTVVLPWVIGDDASDGFDAGPDYDLG